jgi:hypothetical protein
MDFGLDQTTYELVTAKGPEEHENMSAAGIETPFSAKV